MEEKEEIVIYTDGACSGNPGPGGWAAVLIYKENRKEISGGLKETTNNVMELTAVIEALKCWLNLENIFGTRIVERVATSFICINFPVLDFK